MKTVALFSSILLGTLPLLAFNQTSYLFSDIPSGSVALLEAGLTLPQVSVPVELAEKTPSPSKTPLPINFSFSEDQFSDYSNPDQTLQVSNAFNIDSSSRN